MTLKRYEKFDNDFRKWQQRFYNSKEWRTLRNSYRNKQQMICEYCNTLIRGKSICDHIVEITPENKHDKNITLNEKNLMLMHLECHNTKTFKKKNKINFNIEDRKDVNLF